MPSAEQDEARAAIAEELMGELRHELRNNLSTIRNALFYVRRRVATSDIYEADPRLRRFFELVEAEIASASTLVEHGLARGRAIGRLGRAGDQHGAEATARPSARLLLVDDDESVRITLAALLEDEGFSVELAASSAEARARIAESAGYDLIVLDQNLGDGLGVDLVPHVRAEAPRARVVLLSGVEPDPDAPAVDARVAKGDAPEALFRALRGTPAA